MTENPYLSPTPVPSAAQDDVQPAPDVNLRSAFKTYLIVQLILLILTQLLLHSGHFYQFFIIALIGYWLPVLFILARRRQNPTKLDFLFVRYGVIPLWFAALFVAPIVYRFIGEGTERGIHRLF